MTRARPSVEFGPFEKRWITTVIAIRPEDCYERSKTGKQWDASGSMTSWNGPATYPFRLCGSAFPWTDADRRTGWIK